jgi:aquaporin rerated protein, other eukaryote
MSLNPDDGVGIFAELVGMILFTFLGFTAIQSALSFGKNVAPEVTPTSILIIAAAWGLSYMVAISFIAKVSGGHLNPAVTVSMYACGLIPPAKALLYIIMQMAGAMIGAVFADIVTPGMKWLS